MMLAAPKPAPRRSGKAPLRVMIMGLVALAAMLYHGTAMPRPTNLTKNGPPSQRSQFSKVMPVKRRFRFVKFGPKFPQTEDDILPRPRPKQLNSVQCIWFVGDRVKARYPIERSNGGRGYFNEGNGTDVPAHLRNPEEDAAEMAAMGKYVEGGTEGTVVGVFDVGRFTFKYHKPPHFKGRQRPFVLVDFDSPDIPIEAVEEWDLEEIPGGVAQERIAQRKRQRDERRARIMGVDA